ncbi:MAG: glycosyl transferase [Bacteroidetes bacterium]|nr:MAG: glycosyl transferase [Bacteroidota bacterium]PTM14488.1 MAG: glycosyl transferase [Bacteroidota bacterium]
MKTTHRSTSYYLGVTALLSLSYFLLLGYNHLFDWDEINFAECAREMLITGDWLTPRIVFLPFHEKPPFYIWLQAAAMYTLGVGEWAARFPNAVFGGLTLFTLFFMGKCYRNTRFGIIWVLLYYGALLPHFYFKSGIIDPVFNYFIFVSIYCFVQGMAAGSASPPAKGTSGLPWFLAAGLLNALAVLTKGPVGLLLFGLTVGGYLLWNRGQGFPRWSGLLVFALAWLLPLATWLSLDVFYHGIEKTYAFLNYQIELFSKPVAGHQQPFYYHFLVVLLGCFPMSFMALPQLFKKPAGASDGFAQWQFLLFWVVLVLFSIVSTKIVHYSSLAYLPLSFFAAQYVFGLLEQGVAMPRWLRRAILVFGSILGGAIALLPVVGRHKELLVELLQRDVLTVASLQTEVHWTGWESFIGLGFAAGVILAVYHFKRRNILSGLSVLGLATFLLLLTANLWVVPKIAVYSQGPAVAFYETLQNQEVYVAPYGFKSYAHLFYARQQPKANSQYRDQEWLLHGDIDRPVYLVSKANNTLLDGNPNFQLLGVDGAFRFYLREVGE